MASMMPFLGAAAGNAMQAYDQTNYRNKMMDLQKSRLDTSTKLDERRMDLTEQELASRKDQAKRQETMDFLKTFATMAEMSDDASLPALVEQFNATAPSVNPNLSEMSGFRRKGKSQYEFMTDADGKKWLANVGSGGELDIKPLTLPGGQQFTEKVDPVKPIEVGADRALIKPGETEPYYKGPQYGKEKTGKPEKEWVFNPKTRVKREVTQPLADELVGKHGWQRGAPTGSPSGELGDSSVLENIRELAQYDQAKTATMWSQYQKRREEGMDRGKALESVQNEVVSEQEVSRMKELHGKFPDAESIRKAYKNKTINPEDAQLLLQSFHGDEYE